MVSPLGPAPCSCWVRAEGDVAAPGGAEFTPKPRRLAAPPRGQEAVAGCGLGWREPDTCGLAVISDFLPPASDFQNLAASPAA